MDLLEQVAIQSGRMIKPSSRVVVAVSGGVDSMVLLHLLHALAPDHRWRLYVAHFDHQLRGRSSRKDAQLVEQTADRFCLPCMVESGQVKSFARANGLSIEMAARHMRHTFLARVARQHKAKCIALGHQAQDQVELFFLRLLRGAGAGGLSGMKGANPSPVDPRVMLVRPLLNQPKAALTDYARKHRIPFREDATNSTLEIQRNRIRHKLLPVLEREFQPSLQAIILRQMEILGAEDAFLGAAVQARLASRAGEPFAEWPEALQRRALQGALQRLKVAVDFNLIESLRADPPKSVTVAPGLTVRRDARGNVRKVPGRKLDYLQDSKAALLRGKSGRICFGGLKFRWNLGEKSGGLPTRRGGREWFDAERIGSKIVLRHWHPGDRFQPIGMKRPVKLQDLFTNLKVPAQARRQRIVACTVGGDIWWVEGLRISERFKISDGTRRRLCWAWQR